MTDQTPQHVRIEKRDGVTVYSTGFWPGWHEVLGLCFVFALVAGAFAAILFAMYKINTMVEQFIEIGWLHTVLSFVFGFVFDLGLVAGFGFMVLWIPYFLMYQLSPKRFWIKNDVLHHIAYLLGFIPHKRSIPFERILNVDHSSANGGYHVTVHYERKLPKLIFIILVYWNEKLTQWWLTLANGIPTRQEAKTIQNALLEPMTDSEVCRVGRD